MDTVSKYIIATREFVCRSATYMGTLSGIMLFLGSLFVTSEVITRKYFGFTSKGTDDISGIILAWASSWAMAYALYRKGHVRVDVLLVKLPYKMQGVMNLVALLALNFLLALVVLSMWELTFAAFKTGEGRPSALRIPLDWPYAVWAIGYTVFWFLAFLMLLEGIIDASMRRFSNLAFKFGPSSIEAEIQEAMESSTVLKSNKVLE